MSILVKAPLINVNEETARLVEWLKEPGDQVRKGEMLCVLETMKSTFEVDAPGHGYLHLLVEAGDDVKVGQTIAALTENQTDSFELPQAASPLTVTESTSSTRRWTKKAEIIAKRNGLDITEVAEKMQTSRTITETDLKQYLQTQQVSHTSKKQTTTRKRNATERLLIIGGGNVAVLVLDILSRVPNQTAIGIVDDNPAMLGQTVMGCPVLGNSKRVMELWKMHAFDAAALAVGNLPARATLFEKFTQQGIPFTNIIDPSAVIGAECELGSGNMIMAFCRLGPESSIGDNNFLSAYVNIEHHNHMGSHCTFGPNVFMSGGVTIGDQVKFGTGISVEPRLTIGNQVIIASGTILTTHVPDKTIVKTKTNFTF